MLSFLKTKLGIMLMMLFAIIILSITSYTFIRKYNNELKETERMSNNLYNSSFKLDSLKTKSGELQYIVNNLELKKNELVKFNSKLVNDINNLNVKLKNVQSLIVAKPIYIFKLKTNDTIKIEKKTDTTFIANYADNWINMNQRINLIENKKNIKIVQLSITMKDSLIIVNEIKYKHVWIFWRRAIGGKLHISSKNPYFHLEKMESYEIKK